jgi:hypothetical protein
MYTVMTGEHEGDRPLERHSLRLVDNIKKTQHTYYALRGTEVHSRNHCCRGKAISITHSE